MTSFPDNIPLQEWINQQGQEKRKNDPPLPDLRASKKTRAAPEQETPDRLPPNSPEAEQGVLGCCLLDPASAIGQCIELFKDGASVFYDARHATIFAAMIGMFDASETIDIVTLQQRLKDKGLLDQIGGIAYLSSLPDAVPSAQNLEYYAKIVSEKYLLRRMMQTCGGIMSRIYDYEGEVEVLMDEAERDILRIGESRVTTQLRPAMELVRESIDRFEKASQRNGEITGIASGFTDLDRFTDGFQPGNVIVLAARPSIGKTSLALNIADYVCCELKLPVAFFSLEMTAGQLMDRMILSRARVNMRAVRDGFMPDRDYPKITTASGKISTAPIYIDDASGLSILQLRARARRYFQQYGIRFFVIDYLQLMNAIGGGRRQDNRQQEVSDISAGVKSLAKELSVPVLVLAQLNRDLERDKTRKPRLSDLRESGAIEADADIVALMYAPQKTEEDQGENADSYQAQAVNVLIAKNRNGPTGEVQLTFMKAYTRFESASKVSEDDVPPESTQEQMNV